MTEVIREWEWPTRGGPHTWTPPQSSGERGRHHPEWTWWGTGTLLFSKLLAGIEQPCSYSARLLHPLGIDEVCVRGGLWKELQAPRSLPLGHNGQKGTHL